MKLWLLQPAGEAGGFGSPFDYDCSWGFVIRATTEDRARVIAQANGGDEIGLKKDKPIWTDPTITTCVELVPEGDEGIVLEDFHAG